MQNHNQNEIVHFTMPKIGEPEADIQDACKWNADKSLVAIADGASTSVFPSKWATLLVEHFCQQNEDSITSISHQWEEWLRPIQEKWRRYCFEIRQNPNAPWYTKARRNEDYGSATFIGLKFRSPNQAGEKIWEAIAVGDSCVFQIKARSKQFIAFPIDKPDHFKTVTECFHSLPEYNSYAPKSHQGFYEEGDICLLATDALAEWVLKDVERGSARWEELITVATQQEFANFIEQLRQDKLIKDDDTTLCRLKVVAIPKRQASNQRQLPPSKPENQKGSALAKTSPSMVKPSNVPSPHPQPQVDIHGAGNVPKNNQSYGKKTMQSSSKFSVERNTVTSIERLNKRILFVIYLLLAIVVINLIINFSSLAITLFTKNLGTNTTPPQTPPGSSNEQVGSNTGNLFPNLPVPIYAAEGDGNKQPIGYLSKKQSESGSVQLWVHTPVSSINQKKTSINTKDILPIYINKAKPTDLVAEDFLGILLPGTYSLSGTQESKTFKTAQWVKVQVKLAK